MTALQLTYVWRECTDCQWSSRARRRRRRGR